MSRDWTEDEPLDKAAEMAARTVRAAGQAKQAAETIQAAHLAMGAAKSGAAVSGTAAGTALGGPLGAAIGAVFLESGRGSSGSSLSVPVHDCEFHRDYLFLSGFC